MKRLALTLRNSYQPIDRTKLAQVEESMSEGEATPVYNKLKTSPAASGPAGGPAKGPPAAQTQAQMSAAPPAEGAMPPAPVPASTQAQGAGEQNPLPPGHPVSATTSILSGSPTRGGKGRTKAAQAYIDQIKKLADGMTLTPTQSQVLGGATTVKPVQNSGRGLGNWLGNILQGWMSGPKTPAPPAPPKPPKPAGQR